MSSSSCCYHVVVVVVVDRRAVNKMRYSLNCISSFIYEDKASDLVCCRREMSPVMTPSSVKHDAECQAGNVRELCC